MCIYSECASVNKTQYVLGYAIFGIGWLDGAFAKYIGGASFGRVFIWIVVLRARILNV